MAEQFFSLPFWITLCQLIAINLVLAGNNAVVIAFAARSLPAPQRNRAILWGGVAAIALRSTLTIAAFEMLRLPFMKIAGGLLLLSIAVQLLVPHTEGGADDATHGSLFSSAGYVIIVANLAMSLDNVLGVAAAAADDPLMLAIGLAISAVVFAFGSNRALEGMARFPAYYAFAAALIGYLAGDMLAGDMSIKGWLYGHFHWLKNIGLGKLSFSTPGLLGAVSVFALARLYFYATRARGGNTGALREGRLRGVARDRIHFISSALARTRALALLPFAVVIAVTFLGHPFLAYYKHRFAPQVSYYGINVGMSAKEVIGAKSNPKYVVSATLPDNRQILVAFEQLPAGKLPEDYDEWEFPIGPDGTGSLEVMFSRENRRVIQIACYSKTIYCTPVYGITTGFSEDEVVKKLGKPQKVRSSALTETFDYPELHLSLMFTKKTVVMLIARNFND